MKTLLIILTTLLFTSLSFAQKDDWKTGKVLDNASEAVTSRTARTTTGQVNPNGTFNSTTSSGTWTSERVTFTIDTGDMIYVIQRMLVYRWDKTPILTVNGSVQYKLEKGKFVFIDDNKREFKATIVKKILKEDAPNQAKP